MSADTPPAGPRFGIGALVRHDQFGVGRVVGLEPGQYVLVFKGGDTRRVAYGYDGLQAQGAPGDPQADLVRQAVRDVLGDHGWVDVDLELGGRWTGGTLRLIPGKAETQPRDVPIEVFLKKIRFKADQLGTGEWVDMKLTMSHSFVPKALGLNQDDRELGLLVYHLFVGEADKLGTITGTAVVDAGPVIVPSPSPSPAKAAATTTTTKATPAPKK